MRLIWRSVLALAALVSIANVYFVLVVRPRGLDSIPQSWRPRLDRYYLRTKQIRIRDPFILADATTHRYYMYASMAIRAENPSLTYIGDPSAPIGVEVYESEDLDSWSMPLSVLKLEETSQPRVTMLWAPEVHLYQGRYYLLASLTFDERLQPDPERLIRRGTYVFVAEAATGPFVKLSEHSLTPVDWMALDGTLHVEDGVPYLVFCHEWVQTGMGTVELMELLPNLSAAAGPPRTLFSANAATWARGAEYNTVTDGPFIFSCIDGTLLMIWSNNSPKGYCVGIARSATNDIAGPWVQEAKPLVEGGGHGMIFRAMGGELLLTFHLPNEPGRERAHFVKLQESYGKHTLEVVPWSNPSQV